MEELSLLQPLASLGAGGLVAFAILLIFTDRLVTKGRLVEKQQESDGWKKAWELEREANKVRDEQMATLTDAVQIAVENSETTVALLRAMRPTESGQRP